MLNLKAGVWYETECSILIKLTSILKNFILDLETTQLTAEYGIPAQNLVRLVYDKGLREASNAEFIY